MDDGGGANRLRAMICAVVSVVPAGPAHGVGGTAFCPLEGRNAKTSNSTVANTVRRADGTKHDNDTYSTLCPCGTVQYNPDTNGRNNSDVWFVAKPKRRSPVGTSTLKQY